MNEPLQCRAKDELALSRRRWLQGAAGLATGAIAWGIPAPVVARPEVGTARTGRLKQSIAQWCFQKHWTIEQLCQVAKQLGCASVELVEVKDWPTLKKHGLTCAMAYSHWFDKGMNNPKYHEMCLDKMRKAIDACAEYSFPNVITFTGFKEDIAAEEGIRHCVKGYKEIIGHAEKHKVNLCLEMLNSRVKEEMKGHPGYQGDHTEYCMEIIQKVGSERMKLLFDIYHVQIMDGDVMERIKKYAGYIGHIHTAGNPGRGELDDRQEINYKPIMRALADGGFKGYVGQEFLPTRDPLQGLTEAVAVCTV